MWFEKLTGFREENPEQVRSMLLLNGEYLVSQVNGQRMRHGVLTTPNLLELRANTNQTSSHSTQIKLREVVGDVRVLHVAPENAGAMFQVASQFNLLEMVGPQVTPERGVDIYEGDMTQGPACAIACGAATIYRNYFVKIGDQRGQSAHHQIDCLADIGIALGNRDHSLWKMQNGYALATRSGLKQISSHLDSASDPEIDQLRNKLRIGIQSSADVTIGEANHQVSQVFCSALPVAYSRQPATLWKPFAKLVLESAYEATLHAAVQNAKQTGNNRLFLTLLGGGAFGNRMDWIIDAIKRSLDLFRSHDLDIRIVSYGSSTSSVSALVNEFESQQ